MSNLKCPFCKEEIISDLCFLFDKKDKDYTSGRQIYKCNKCGLFGTKELWQELIRTRKALDVATDKLKGIKAYYDDSYADPHTFVNWHSVAQRLANDVDDAIKEIIALEQKD